MNENLSIHSVTLFSDAKATKQRYAICAANGEPLWFGRFFDGDSDFTGEQSTGELSAARKAIWLASKIKEAIGATQLHLNLIVDANWLCTLSGKAAVLRSDAANKGIKLQMKWISGAKNPADALTVTSGFKKWDDNDLVSLATITTEAEITAATEAEEEAEQEARENAPVLRRPSRHVDRVKFDTAGVSAADLNEWLNSHKDEWSTMLAEANAAGLGRKDRQERRAQVVAAWVAAGKP